MNRRVVAPAAACLAVSLVACTPALPDSVIPGSHITVGWDGRFTSANAVAAPTSGNQDIAEVIRSDFGDFIDGTRVPDESFGTISVVSEEPFTVRFDLAEPRWSDGIPVDAADLLLGWAGNAGYFVAEDAGDAEPDMAGEEDARPLVPTVDEFARAIDVTFSPGDIAWEHAVTVPVPAHVLGMRAFHLDDPMAAKLAVIDAIESDDAEEIADMAAVWNEGFTIPEDGNIPPELLLSNGPYRVQSVQADDAGQTVKLVPNSEYAGTVTATTAEIDLQPQGADPLVAAGDSLDIVQVTPTKANFAAVNAFERQDFLVNTTHDGTMWALFVKPEGMFTRQQVRVALLRTINARSMIDAGAGEWASAYTATTSMLAAPNLPSYTVVSEDSGFAVTLGTPPDDPARAREVAGVTPTDRVCVLYDRTSEFASGAFEGMRAAAAEAGWVVTDCGSSDFETALAGGNWNAVIARVPIPETPDQIAEQWGTGGSASMTGQSDPNRDQLIATYGQTTDMYQAREVLAQIEATIVRAAVVLPLAVNPRLTVIDRAVQGVSSRSGAVPPILNGLTQWTTAG